MDLGPKPSPKTEPPEIVPGGPDAPDYDGGGVVRDLRASNPPTPGDEEVGMGVSSERVGHTGPGQTGTDGVKDTSATSDVTNDGDTDVPPEQRPGNVETNPQGIEPKAGYPSLDPRSKGEG